VAIRIPRIAAGTEMLQRSLSHRDCFDLKHQGEAENAEAVPKQQFVQREIEALALHQRVLDRPRACCADARATAPMGMSRPNNTEVISQANTVDRKALGDQPETRRQSGMSSL